MSCFALLDDCNATETAPCSRLYSAYLGEIRCTQATDLNACWDQARSGLQQGQFAVVLIDYEWGALHLMSSHRQHTDLNEPSLRFLMFERCEKKSSSQVDDWLAQKSDSDSKKYTQAASIEWVQQSLEKASYQKSITQIQEWIRQGQTYQINYTYQCQGWAQGSPFELYQKLRAKQPVQFGALIHFEAHSKSTAYPWILSFSPELFVRHHQGELSTRPMKGTAPRDSNPTQDAENAHWLQHNPKNRAENLMIVDLLRNDLSKIAKMGSVQVSNLFKIESYASLHQMTSTITAQLKNGLNMPDVLRALFPCGSITGAPKHHTQSLINKLETTPRGLYTGAIGWVDPITADEVCPSFCFSVVIRTLMLGTQNAQGQRAVTMGVGSGIVADSVAEDEYQETQLKARFVSDAFPTHSGT
jgi:para-aminobenzoate synthetase / 4-amino-4-deoxychorismate lyase